MVSGRKIRGTKAVLARVAPIQRAEHLVSKGEPDVGGAKSGPKKCSRRNPVPEIRQRSHSDLVWQPIGEAVKSLSSGCLCSPNSAIQAEGSLHPVSS